MEKLVEAIRIVQIKPVTVGYNTKKTIIILSIVDDHASADILIDRHLSEEHNNKYAQPEVKVVVESAVPSLPNYFPGTYVLISVVILQSTNANRVKIFPLSLDQLTWKCQASQNLPTFPSHASEIGIGCNIMLKFLHACEFILLVRLFQKFWFECIASIML
jgi:hypothetical protein